MKESRILKCTSYILIPILTLIIIITAFYEVGKEVVKEDNYNSEYFKTDDFLNNFMYLLSDGTSELIYDNEKYNSVEDGENKICYYGNFEEYNYNNIKDFYYLIQYQNLAFTNVELTENTNTIDEIKNYITQEDGKKANIINGNVEANSELIKNKALKYFNRFNFTYYTINIEEQNQNLNEYEYENMTKEYYIEDEELSTNTITKEKEYHETNIADFQIYTTYKEEILLGTDNIILEQIINILSPYEQIMIYIMPVSAILLALILIYLIISIGHIKGKEEIDLNDLDKIPLEIIYIISFFIIGMIICIPVAIIEYNNTNLNLFISLFLLAYFVSYVFGMSSLVTTIKRIKAKAFWKYTITGKICKWFIRFCKKIWKALKGGYNSITETWNKLAKLILIIFLYIIVSIILMAIFNILGLLISIGIGIYLLYKFNLRINCYEHIERHLKAIYDGDHSSKLNPDDFTKEFQDIVKYINDVSSGFENAIQEGIKSERMKTELITNVSHDIKTPLTSIINYVDLLKKENIENEKAKEYIDILDNKSQRLKKLIEDLVEVSKASSGNVKLNMEKIDICELIKQATGEFEDKFKSKNLDVIYNANEENIYINADNRYMYRIIENLFVNISKYALDSSRVYIDIIKNDLKVKIAVKNISKERLNITPDELMQRFVRGDKSRTTEGSGLGISISKSLTELQNGKFTLNVDGDLFKVELEFDII